MSHVITVAKSQPDKLRLLFSAPEQQATSCSAGGRVREIDPSRPALTLIAHKSFRKFIWMLKPRLLLRVFLGKKGVYRYSEIRYGSASGLELLLNF